MTEFERKILTEIDALRREVTFLRAEVRLTKKERNDRVFVAEIAERFGVSQETVRRMQGQFAKLHKLHKKTETKRIYWHRADYNAWLEDIGEPVERQAAKQIRKLMQRKKKA